MAIAPATTAPDRMKVALIAPQSALYSGGLERHVRELARGLIGRGATVELLRPNPEARTIRMSQTDGVVEWRFAASHHSPPVPIPPALAEYLHRKVSSFDVIHAHGRRMLLALAAARVRPGRLVFSPLAPVERMLRWPYTGATRAAVDFASATICMSRSDAALLCSALPTAATRVRIVPEGVDISAIRGATPFPSGRTVALSVGRLVRHKRVDRAIAAMAALVPTFELVVVGDGPARRRLKAYAADLQVGSRVRFVGRVSDGNLHRWLKTARLVVTLSQREAFGLQVLEGVAAGAPVVASDIPAHREASEYVPNGAVTFVAPEGSPFEVADAIKAAVADPAPAPVAALPSWADVVDETLDVYQELMRRPPTNGARAGRLRGLRWHERRGRPDAAIEG
jgi:glycosyltransferase involved in cell wall biosynthesis